MKDWTINLWPAVMWNLAGLEYLDVIDKQGSVAACAKHFRRTPATVNAAVLKLEKELGYDVVDHQRGRSGANPTPAGKQLLSWFRGLARRAQEVETAAEALKANPGGRGKRTFRVVASTTTCELLVPRWLRLLQDQGSAPFVSLTSSRSAAVMEQVERDDEYNVGFIANGYDDEELGNFGFESRVVGSDEILIVVPPDHRWVVYHNSKINADELIREPHLARQPGSGAREVFFTKIKEHAGEAVAEKLQIRSITTNNTLALLTSVLEFKRPAALSSLAVSDQLASGKLCKIEVEGVPSMVRERRAIWRKGTEDALRDRLVKIAELNSIYVPKPPPPR